MYVFDRGYLGYEGFDHMTDDGYFFVSRLQKNAVTRVLGTFELPEDSTVLTDEIIVIGTSQNRAEHLFRRINILDSEGNELPLIINSFDLRTDEIAELYKSR